MKIEKSNIRYQYDPDSRKLMVYLGDKLTGVFTGGFAEEQFLKQLESGVKVEVTSFAEKTRKAKVRHLRALWCKLNIDQYRAAILAPYGVESTADLNVIQLDELIRRFTAEYNKPANEPIRRLRSDVLTVLNKLGVYSDQGDWKAVNAYLMQPQIAGKMLFNLSEDELIVLRKKLHSILDKQQIMDVNIQKVKNWN